MTKKPILTYFSLNGALNWVAVQTNSINITRQTCFGVKLCTADKFISWMVVMAEYDPRQELMASQQSLPGKYEHQFNKQRNWGNVAILSHLSQWEQAAEQVSCREIQKVL